jgi:hypothetical protein
VRPKQMAWMLTLFLLFPIPGNTQSPHSASTTQRGIPGGAPAGDEQSQERLASEMAKKANLERQALLKSDTDKLVKLAGELKDYVNKSNENVLSLDVVKKAEEIEKLAHAVKEKMKGPN